MFVKVHEQIFNSSIMEEDLETRYIWFCLLTLADREGFVDMTIAAIARRINIDEQAVNDAIDKFMQPDPSSRTATQEGRRLEKIRESFGWKIINYIHYRNLRSEENRRDYMRNYMKDRRDVNKKANTDVNCKQSKPSLAHTDTDTDTDTNNINVKHTYLDCVSLTKSQYDSLTTLYGDNGAQERIQNLNEYLMSKGKKYKSHYHTILMWERKNKPLIFTKPKRCCALCTTEFNERETTYDYEGKKICGKCDMKKTKEKFGGQKAL